MAVLQEIKVPLISVNDRSLTVLETPFSTGDQVKKDETVLVFETSKTAYDVLAEADGYIQYLCEVASDYEVNDFVAIIFSSLSECKDVLLTKNSFKQPGAKTRSAGVNWNGKTAFSKGAMALIELHQLQQEVFSGKDFINKNDVEFYLGKGTGKNNKRQFPPAPDKSKKIYQALPGTTNVITEELALNKKREIEYLTSVQSEGLTSTVNTFVETEGIFVHLNEAMQALKNSLLPVTIYEASRLLQKYKELNAFYSADSISFYEKINIGFAIDIEKGLKVLKIADAPNKTLAQIEAEILSLSEKYLDDSLQYDDLSDITFTITDLSAEDVAFFRPLVNFMNSAILGIASNDEKLSRCIFSVTFDHRVTEGKLVARFLKELKYRLESYQSKHSGMLHQITCFRCRKSLAEDLSDVGFTKCITPKGENAFVCQSCLKGF